MNGWDAVTNMDGNNDDYDTDPKLLVMNALWHDGNAVILYITSLFLFTEIRYVNQPQDHFEFTGVRVYYDFSPGSAESVMLVNRL